MQGIYTYIPETNHVPKQYNVAAVLSLLFMVPISLAIVVVVIIIIIIQQVVQCVHIFLCQFINYIIL
jgi:hypothetical protein